MRVLSPSELKLTQLRADIPVELSVSYFPVCLRAFEKLEGENLKPYSDQISGMLDAAITDLDCVGLRKPTRSRDGTYINYNRFIDRGHYSTLGENGTKLNNCYNVEYVIFPVDHLVFEADLSKHSLAPVPGYLYFQCNMTLAREGSGSRRSGSRYLDEREYEPLLNQDYLAKSGVKLSPSDERRELEKLNWRGPIADIEHMTNSRVIHKQVYNSGGYSPSLTTAEYILETPLDFPPGFVQETVNSFRRRWVKISKTARRFCELVTDSAQAELEEPLPKQKKKQTTELASFPLGLSKLQGPDVSWHRSDDPWFVQSVLLARLIGGRFWQYALGYLESKIGNRSRSTT